MEIFTEDIKTLYEKHYQAEAWGQSSYTGKSPGETLALASVWKDGFSVPDMAGDFKKAVGWRILDVKYGPGRSSSG